MAGTVIRRPRNPEDGRDDGSKAASPAALSDNLGKLLDASARESAQLAEAEKRLGRSSRSEPAIHITTREPAATATRVPVRAGATSRATVSHVKTVRPMQSPLPVSTHQQLSGMDQWIQSRMDHLAEVDTRLDEKLRRLETMETGIAELSSRLSAHIDRVAPTAAAIQDAQDAVARLVDEAVERAKAGAEGMVRKIDQRAEELRTLESTLAQRIERLQTTSRELLVAVGDQIKQAVESGMAEWTKRFAPAIESAEQRSGLAVDAIRKQAAELQQATDEHLQSVRDQSEAMLADTETRINGEVDACLRVVREAAAASATEMHQQSDACIRAAVESAEQVRSAMDALADSAVDGLQSSIREMEDRSGNKARRRLRAFDRLSRRLVDELHAKMLAMGLEQRSTLEHEAETIKAQTSDCLTAMGEQSRAGESDRLEELRLLQEQVVAAGHRQARELEVRTGGLVSAVEAEIGQALEKARREVKAIALPLDQAMDVFRRQIQATILSLQQRARESQELFEHDSATQLARFDGQLADKRRHAEAIIEALDAHIQQAAADGMARIEEMDGPIANRMDQLRQRSEELIRRTDESMLKKFDAVEERCRQITDAVVEQLEERKQQAATMISQSAAAIDHLADQAEQRLREADVPARRKVARHLLAARRLMAIYEARFIRRSAQWRNDAGAMLSRLSVELMQLQQSGEQAEQILQKLTGRFDEGLMSFACRADDALADSQQRFESMIQGLSERLQGLDGRGQAVCEAVEKQLDRHYHDASERLKTLMVPADRQFEQARARVEALAVEIGHRVSQTYDHARQEASRSQTALLARLDDAKRELEERQIRLQEDLKVVLMQVREESEQITVPASLALSKLQQQARLIEDEWRSTFELRLTEFARKAEQHQELVRCRVDELYKDAETWLRFFDYEVAQKIADPSQPIIIDPKPEPDLAAGSIEVDEAALEHSADGDRSASGPDAQQRQARSHHDDQA